MFPIRLWCCMFMTRRLRVTIGNDLDLLFLRTINELDLLLLFRRIAICLILNMSIRSYYQCWLIVVIINLKDGLCIRSESFLVIELFKLKFRLEGLYELLLSLFLFFIHLLHKSLSFFLIIQTLHWKFNQFRKTRLLIQRLIIKELLDQILKSIFFKFFFIPLFQNLTQLLERLMPWLLWLIQNLNFIVTLHETLPKQPFTAL